MARSHIFVRELNRNAASYADDLPVAENAIRYSGHYFPENAFALPSTRVMLAVQNKRIVATQAWFCPLVMGSVVWANDPTNKEKAEAMSQFTRQAYTECHRLGLLELLAFSNTKETRAYAFRHGFEKLQHQPLRMGVR